VPEPLTLPLTVEDLTATWFSTAFGHEVADATVLDRSSGTTGRAQVALRGDPGLPPSVFVKLAPFDEQQREFVNLIGMGVAEARFYRDLAGDVPVRVPGVWFADTDGDRYVMVLEDLTLRGCRFPTPDDADIADRARDIVEQLAALHVAFWDSDRFAPGGDLEWLASRAAMSGGAGRGLVQQATAVLGDEMGPSFRRIADVYVAHADEIVRLWTQDTGTLIHGDPHLGNLFVDVEDGNRTGFLDWAVLCRAPGVRDVAYVLCNSMAADARAAHERGLVEHYCELLAAGGVALDVEKAWEQYRLFAVYSWVAAAATAGMGSKWQPIDVGISATRRATDACTHLDSAGLIESLVG
jgi:Phosphotransferase enzyme family